ncbi:MAG: AMP-binding protein, partial [Gemmatimonadales bacterium]
MSPTSSAASGSPVSGCTTRSARPGWGRPTLPRFEVEPWLVLVRRHRPRAVSLVPSAVRMVLDAEVDPEDLASIQVVTSGSAKLDPDVQLVFERRYGIPVLPSYGATEFAGGVA